MTPEHTHLFWIGFSLGTVVLGVLCLASNTPVGDYAAGATISWGSFWAVSEAIDLYYGRA